MPNKDTPHGWAGALHVNLAMDVDFPSRTSCADCDLPMVMENYDELAVCPDCLDSRLADERALREPAIIAGAQSGAMHIARARGDFDRDARFTGNPAPRPRLQPRLDSK